MRISVRVSTGRQFARAEAFSNLGVCSPGIVQSIRVLDSLVCRHFSSGRSVLLTLAQTDPCMGGGSSARRCSPQWAHGSAGGGERTPLAIISSTVRSRAMSAVKFSVPASAVSLHDGTRVGDGGEWWEASGSTMAHAGRLIAPEAQGIDVRGRGG